MRPDITDQFQNISDSHNFTIASKITSKVAKYFSGRSLDEAQL